ncbi:MAG: NAD+ synthase [Candidatus Heimdallarchaeota archaeon]
MSLDQSVFDIDCEAVSSQIEKFIQDYVQDSHTKGVVIGLSGGIDSAVTAALAVRALGKDKVLGFMLPNAALAQSYEDDARKHAKQMGIVVKKIAIADLVSSFVDLVDDEVAENKLAVGNAMARFRMVLLYGYANHLNYLVLGTSNKTELLVGYLTKYGDGGIDFEPCGGLYKTQIRLLAKYLEIPKEIIDKPPSAGLWEGQTDEGELGITYEDLDLILYGLDKGLSKEDIAKELKIDEKLIEKTVKLVKSSEHKRKMPPVYEFD